MQEHVLTQEELHKLQRVELEMLIEVDRICRKNHIVYSLDGGTLLGAVRHRGFIPWDDDIDVIMLRKEYTRFRNACKKDLDRKRFFLQDFTTDPHYRWGYAKLRRKGTEYVRLGQEMLKQKTGVFIDIFVADNVPDGYIKRRLHHFACFCIRKVLYSPVGAHQNRNAGIRFLYRLLSLIPRNAVFRARNLLADRSDRKRTKLISHYTLEYPRSCRYGLPRSCFDKMRDLEFEGYLFPCFTDYHTYLSMHYGDYMQLPPENERKPHLKASKLEVIDVENL